MGTRWSPCNFSKFFGWWKQRNHNKTRRTQLSSRPRLEALEDRSLPSASPLSSVLFEMPSSPAWMDKTDSPARFSEIEIADTGIDNLYEATGPAERIEHFAEALQQMPHLGYVETNHIISAAVMPNDSSVGSLWGMHGTFGINADDAWNTSTGSLTQTVAIIDTGIDYKHPDLYLNIWINQDEIPNAIRNNLTDVDGNGLITFNDLNDPINQGPGKIIDHDGDGRITGGDLLHNASGWQTGTDTDGNGFIDDLIGWDFVNNDNNPYDGNSHGTHVAGTVGAIGNNGIGVAGVNWNVLLMPAQILSASGSGYTSNAVKAVYYSANEGATVSNNSWGGGGYSNSLQSAIDYAATKNQLFIAAAGNSSVNNDSSPHYPSSYTNDNVISVASTTSSGGLSWFSNYGATSVDVGAPGSSILSTVPSGGYGWKSGTSMATPHVAGAAALVYAVHPDWTHAQVKSQLMNTVTPLSSLSGITVTGGLVNAGEALIDGPEIRVFGSRDVQNGATFDLGTTLPGVPLSKTFTIQNAGNENLLLGSLTITGSAFTLESGLTDTNLAPGDETTFTVHMAAQSTLGTYTGGVSIVNNDEDESPFDFGLTAEVGNSVIIDNGENGFSTIGEWTTWSGQGYHSDVDESLAGNGSDVATWTFNVTPGDYKVSATWTTWSNRATNAPFAIYDGSSLVGSAQVNQQASPNDFTDSGVAWEDLGNVTITGNTLLVKLSDNANGRLNADAIRIESVAPAPSAPEIQVFDDGSDIADDTGSVNYGQTPPGTPVSKTFTVNNLGSANLTLDLNISVPTGFSLAAGFGQTTLAPGESTTFTVRLDAVAQGTYTGMVSFNTNDSDENPFNFTVSGTVASVPTVQIIDNGDSGFQTEGAWTRWDNQGYDGDVHESLAGNGSDVATWTFNVAPGEYKVSATWTTWSNRATNAPFALYDGSTVVGTAQVNQQASPNDFTHSGVAWEDLENVTITGNTLVVKLSDNANGRLNADAIRIESVAPAPSAPEIQVLDGGSDIADDTGSVNYGQTPPGTPVSKTFTVNNLGSADLTLDSNISVPTGFSLAAGFGQTTLAPGESTTFTVRLDAVAQGTYTGMVSFNTNDSDENPFNFTVSGTVASVPTVQIIDNGDSGFHTDGAWTRWDNQGYEGDVHESLSGSGNDVATWTFNVAPGQYKVSATWTTWSNRATNAPFSIYDGGSLVASTQVNQQSSPNDFADAGISWENLGTVTITGNTLVVTLSDNADGRLNADAIRIESV